MRKLKLKEKFKSIKKAPSNRYKMDHKFGPNSFSVFKMKCSYCKEGHLVANCTDILNFFVN